MDALTHVLAHLPPGAGYALLVAAVLAESLLLVGAFVPTFTLLLAAGALARTGLLHLPLVVAAAGGAVVAGDALAHRTGRLLGGRLRTGRPGRRIPGAAWRRATDLMNAHGGRAVFLCRFLPVLRTLAPHLAGATDVPYRRMAPYSTAAAVLWAGAEAGAGYLATTSVEHLVTVGGTALAVTAGAGATVTCLWLTRRHRGRRTVRRPDDSTGPQVDQADQRSVPGGVLGSAQVVVGVLAPGLDDSGHDRLDDGEGRHEAVVGGGRGDPARQCDVGPAGHRYDQAGAVTP